MVGGSSRNDIFSWQHEECGADKKNARVNLLNIILIIGFYQTLLFSVIILLRKQKSKSDYFLSGLFMIYGITLLLGFLEIYNRSHDYPYPFLINASTPFIFLHGPAIWFYIKSLTTPKFSFKSKYLLHFLPFFVVFVILFFNIYRLPAAEKILLEQSEAFRDDISFPLIIILIAIFTQGYFVWGLILIKNYKQKIKEYFSEISSVDLSWLRILLITSMVFYAGTSLLYILDYAFRFLSYHGLQTIGFSYQAVFILVLGYRGYTQGNVFSSSKMTAFPDEKQRVQAEYIAVTDKDAEFTQRLVTYTKNEKPYLNPELTLGTLAKELGVTPDYLSLILNTKLHRNFFDFINHHRVEEFKQICREHPDKNSTIMSMAWDAGFNSKPTFNRVFKKITGITPGEFVRSSHAK